MGASQHKRGEEQLEHKTLTTRVTSFALETSLSILSLGDQATEDGMRTRKRWCAHPTSSETNLEEISIRKTERLKVGRV